MKNLLISLALASLFFGCEKTTKIEDIPDHMRTFATKVEAYDPGIYEKSVPLRVLDIQTDHNGYILDMDYTTTYAKAQFHVVENHNQNGDLQVDFCFTYG